MDQLLEVKSDVADIENIIAVLENKVEIGSFEELARQGADGPHKVERAEHLRLAD